MSEQKPILMSGIKPSGELHIGNYFGAMRQQVELFKSGEYQCYIMVADYHALNTMQNAAEMRQRTLELTAAYIAVGLDPEQVVLFKQSDVPAHTELTWIFETMTPVPYLMRGHAFKDQVARVWSKYMDDRNLKTPDEYTNSRGKEDPRYDNQVEIMYSGIETGVLTYPLLMAADILLYDAAVVPVGQDQKQHIEYARDTAEKFNRIFASEDAPVFALPKEYIMADVAIVPGIDGQKMSKSYGNVIPLFASREEISERVMAIVTDSSGDRPENVYAIHKLLKSEDELASLYEANTGKYKALKEALIEDLDAFIAPMREKYESLRSNPDEIARVLKAGGQQARERAETKMQAVRKAIGVN